MKFLVSRVKPIEGKSKIVGKFSVRIDDTIDLNDFSLVRNDHGGFFASPPSRKYEKGDGTVGYSKYIYFLDGDLFQQITDQVVNELGLGHQNAAESEGQSQGQFNPDDEMPF